MRIDDFDFHLPEKLIAQFPASPRDACKLLVIDRKAESLSDKHFFDLKSLLKPDDVLVFNDSKVIPARLVVHPEGQADRKLEVFLLRQAAEDSDNEWFCIGKPGKALKVGKKFHLSDALNLEVLEVFADGQRRIRFSLNGKALREELDRFGLPPFPPYIRNPKASFDDYQTVYAKPEGSVAAPTAGLHFTSKLLHQLKALGVQCEFVTLHVGLGTFQPVKVAQVEQHLMHEESYYLSPQTAKRLQQAHRHGRRIIAVGTTSVRVLESTFKPKFGFIPGFGETSIYIYPGFQWKVVKGLITNFHLPKSTLLLLVSSFASKKLMQKAYNHAIHHYYRFYSFGDAMFIV